MQTGLGRRSSDEKIAVSAGRRVYGRAVHGQPRRGCPRRRCAVDGRDAGDRAMDEPVRNHVCLPPGPSHGRLPSAHLHPQERAAVRRPSNDRIGTRRLAPWSRAEDDRARGTGVRKGAGADRAGWRTPVSRAPSSAFQRCDRTYCPAGRRAEHGRSPTCCASPRSTSAPCG